MCVNASVKTLNNYNDFEHISKHVLSCILEKKDGDVSNHGELRFRTIHEVTIVEYIRCVEQGKRGLEQSIKELL